MIQGSAQNRNRWYKDQHKIAELPSRLVALLNTAKATWNYCKRTKTMEKQQQQFYIKFWIKRPAQCSHILQRNTNINATNVKESVKNKLATLGDAIASHLKLSINHWLTNKLNILEMLNTKLIPCSSRADCCGRPGPTCLGKILQAREHYSAEVNNILQYFGMLWHV